MKDKEEIVIVCAVRTPFSKFDTAMADIPSIDLGVSVMKDMKKGIEPWTSIWAKST